MNFVHEFHEYTRIKNKIGNNTTKECHFGWKSAFEYNILRRIQDKMTDQESCDI